MTTRTTIGGLAKVLQAILSLDPRARERFIGSMQRLHRALDVLSEHQGLVLCAARDRIASGVDAFHLLPIFDQFALLERDEQDQILALAGKASRSIEALVKELDRWARARTSAA